MSYRPTIGHPALLVYRECPCGQFACTGEGAAAPVCAQCGGYFVPGGGPRGGEPMYGENVHESRAIRCLGFVGFLTSEQGAVVLVHRIRRLLGFIYPYGIGDGASSRTGHLGNSHLEQRFDRYYTTAETQAQSDEIKAAIAAQRATGKAADED